MQLKTILPRCSHATLTEPLRVIDALALAGVLGARYLEVSRRDENPLFLHNMP
jgi:hypothetical protein